VAVVDTTNTTSEVAVAGAGSLAVSPTGANAGDVYVTNASQVSVIDPTGTVIYTIPIDGTPRDVAVAPAGVPNAGYVYVAASGGVVYVIDPSSQSVVGGITIGFTLNDIEVSPTGSKAGYVYGTRTIDDMVVVISPYDAQNPSTIDTVQVGGGPVSLAISPTGANAGNVYVANEFTNAVSVIDPSNNVSTFTLGNGGYSTVSQGYFFQPKVVAVSPTGANAGYVYVGGFQGDIAVINPSGTYVGNIGGSFGYDPGGLAVGPTGANAGNIYLASASDRNLRVLSPAGAVLETTFVGVWASGIAIAP